MAAALASNNEWVSISGERLHSLSIGEIKAKMQTRKDCTNSATKYQDDRIGLRRHSGLHSSLCTMAHSNGGKIVTDARSPNQSSTTSANNPLSSSLHLTSSMASIHTLVIGEPYLLRTADLCEAYNVSCAFRGGYEKCPGHRDYDPEFVDGGEPGETISCTCRCHRVPN